MSPSLDQRLGPWRGLPNINQIFEPCKTTIYTFCLQPWMGQRQFNHHLQIQSTGLCMNCSSHRSVILPSTVKSKYDRWNYAAWVLIRFVYNYFVCLLSDFKNQRQ